MCITWTHFSVRFISHPVSASHKITAPKLAYANVISDCIKSFLRTKLLLLQKQINLVSQDSFLANPLGPSFFVSVFVHGWLLCFSIFDR